MNPDSLNQAADTLSKFIETLSPSWYKKTIFYGQKLVQDMRQMAREKSAITRAICTNCGEKCCNGIDCYYKEETP